MVKELFRKGQILPKGNTLYVEDYTLPNEPLEEFIKKEFGENLKEIGSLCFENCNFEFYEYYLEIIIDEKALGCIFSNCTFGQIFCHEATKNDLEFEFCTFMEDFVFSTYNNKRIEFKEGLSFYNCVFKGDILFYGFGKIIEFKEDISFFKCTFYKNFKFNECTFSKSLSFVGTNFKNILSFEKVKIVEYKLTDNIFEKNMSFSSLEIKQNFIFTNNSFLPSQGFIGLHLGKNIEIDRDTYRIIKNQSENNKDFVLANEYYKRENDQYIEELKADFKKSNTKIADVSKLIVLYFGKFSSQHLSNWLLPLFWLIFINFISFITLTKGCSSFELAKYIGFILSPINIDIDYIKNNLGGYYFSALFVKTISLILIYYIIITFRRVARRS